MGYLVPEDGYYWIKSYLHLDAEIVWVKDGLVHFFGRLSQEVDNEWVQEHIQWLEKIEEIA